MGSLLLLWKTHVGGYNIICIDMRKPWISISIENGFVCVERKYVDNISHFVIFVFSSGWLFIVFRKKFGILYVDRFEKGNYDVVVIGKQNNVIVTLVMRKHDYIRKIADCFYGKTKINFNDNR